MHEQPHFDALGAQKTGRALAKLQDDSLDRLILVTHRCSHHEARTMVPHPTEGQFHVTGEPIEGADCGNGLPNLYLCLSLQLARVISLSPDSRRFQLSLTATACEGNH